MIKQYITQALAQLRQHPIISAVSIIGTALAIFLIMLVVMMQQVKTAPFAPESNRDRFLHVHYMSISIKKMVEYKESVESSFVSKPVMSWQIGFGLESVGPSSSLEDAISQIERYIAEQEF